MAITPKELVEPIYAPVALTDVYDVPLSTTVIIDKFTAANVGSVDATLTVHLVTAATSVNPGNRVLSDRTIAPGQTYLVPEAIGHVLEASGSIYMICSSANTLAVRVSGREIT